MSVGTAFERGAAGVMTDIAFTTCDLVAAAATGSASPCAAGCEGKGAGEIG